MTHNDRNHYAAKHPPGIQLNPQIAESVKKKISDDKITCAAAHRIARDLNVSPSDVGVVLDLLETRISKCQLGLFGYGPQKKIVQPLKKVSPLLREAIENAMVKDRLPCASSWKIAEKFSVPKMDVAAACETLKIGISSCQLGAFV
ncbi:MAG: hypothetical protein JW786_02600 [Desulfobacterales bacterium]|nr:hypothetical protein [Desulfobacterales bacterium]